MNPDENLYDAPDDLPENFKDAPEVPMPPPMIMLLALTLGIVLDWLFPVDFGHGWGGFGLIVLIGAIGGIFWAGSQFKKTGTNIPTYQPALALIEDGPYAYSRNPIYIGFLLGYAGLAMMADAPVMLLLLAPLYVIFEKKVIEPEEKYLEIKFGDRYRVYAHAVRRWL